MAADLSQQNSEPSNHHATFVRRCEPGATVYGRSILRRLEQAGSDELHEASARAASLRQSSSAKSITTRPAVGSPTETSPPQ
jgi:hypothetical protein